MMLLIIIDRIGADKLKISAQVECLLRPAYEKLKKVYQRDQKSKFTKNITVTDREMSDITIILTKFISIMLKSDDEAERKSAENLNFVFDDFKGLTKESRASQSAKTAKLIELLNGEYADDVERIGAGKWVTKLERLNGEMISAMDGRVNEKSEKYELNAASVKKEAIYAYRVICKQVEVGVATEGSANYSEFIRNINNLIGGFNAGKSVTVKDDDEKEENVPEVPKEEEKYPNAKEWHSEVRISDSLEGEIYYILVDGKKEYYKLIDRYQVSKMPGSEGADKIWEKLI